MKKLVVFMCILLPTLANAAAGSTEAIKSMYISSYDGVVIRQNTTVNPAQCSSVDNYFLEKTNPNFKEIYAMVLAAKISGDVVLFSIHNTICVTTGSVTRPKITSISLP